MGNNFPDSRNLSLILEWHGWSLLDITAPPARIEPLSWDEIEMRELARHYELHHRYLLLPVPEENERFRDAYAKSRTESLFPVLKFSKGKLPYGVEAWDGYATQGYAYYLLNEFYFSENKISVFSAPCVYSNYSSLVSIPSQNAIEVFSQHFAIVQFTDKGVKMKKPRKEYVN